MVANLDSSLLSSVCPTGKICVELFLHPEPEAACKCISIVALTAALGHFLKLLDIAPAENDVVRLEGCCQAFNNIKDIFAPFVLTVPLQTSKADVVLVGSLAIGKVAELHGLQESVDNHGGAKARTQAKEQHASTLVAAQRLHGGVINHLDRASESLLEVKPDPAGSEVVRIVEDTALQHRSRIPDRDGLVLPFGGELLDLGHHLLGCHLRARYELLRRCLPTSEYLFVCPTHIDR